MTAKPINGHNSLQEQILKLTLQASTQHFAMLERVAKDLAKGHGAWDGKTEPPPPSAIAFGQRMAFAHLPPKQGNARNIARTEVLLDGAKVCLVVTTTDLLNGAIKTEVKAPR